MCLFPILNARDSVSHARFFHNFHLIVENDVCSLIGAVAAFAGIILSVFLLLMARLRFQNWAINGL